jgi:hypothetical protein
MDKRWMYDEARKTLLVEDIKPTFLEDLSARPPKVASQPAREKYVILSSGGGAVTWTGRIVDKIAYNWYHVVPVCLGEPGSLPVALGDARTACNLGESFMYEGTLPANTYVVFWHVGDYYVFDHPA